VWWRKHDNIFSRFDRVPACDGRTDRQTDRQTDVKPIAITCFSIADARNKRNHLQIAKHGFSQATVCVCVCSVCPTCHHWNQYYHCQWEQEGVSFCNQPKAHYLATSRYVVAFSRFAGAGIWLRHILASPGYAPGTIAVIVTWMERGLPVKRIAACTHLSSTVSQ